MRAAAGSLKGAVCLRRVGNYRLLIWKRGAESQRQFDVKAVEMCFSCFGLKVITFSLRLLYEAEFIFIKCSVQSVLQLMSLKSDPSDVTKGADASCRLMTPNLVFIQTAANSFVSPPACRRRKQRAKYAVCLVSLTFSSIIKRLLDVRACSLKIQCKKQKEERSGNGCDLSIVSFAHCEKELCDKMP